MHTNHYEHGCRLWLCCHLLCPLPLTLQSTLPGLQGMLLVLLGSQLVCSQLNYSSEHVEIEAHVYMYIYMQVHIDLIVQDSLTLLNGL